MHLLSAKNIILLLKVLRLITTAWRAGGSTTPRLLVSPRRRRRVFHSLERKQYSKNTFSFSPFSSLLLRRYISYLFGNVGMGNGIRSSLLPVSHQGLWVCRMLASSASGSEVKSQGQALWGRWCQQGGCKILRSPCGKTPKSTKFLLVVKMICWFPYVCSYLLTFTSELGNMGVIYLPLKTPKHNIYVVQLHFSSLYRISDIPQRFLGGSCEPSRRTLWHSLASQRWCKEGVYCTDSRRKEGDQRTAVWAVSKLRVYLLSIFPYHSSPNCFSDPK